MINGCGLDRQKPSFKLVALAEVTWQCKLFYRKMQFQWHNPMLTKRPLSKDWILKISWILQENNKSESQTYKRYLCVFLLPTTCDCKLSCVDLSTFLVSSSFGRKTSNESAKVLPHLRTQCIPANNQPAWMTMDCCVNDVIAFLNLHPQNKLLWLRTRAKVVEEKQKEQWSIWIFTL